MLLCNVLVADEQESDMIVEPFWRAKVSLSFSILTQINKWSSFKSDNDRHRMSDSTANAECKGTY